jgi:hypothetical protein
LKRQEKELGNRSSPEWLRAELTLGRGQLLVHRAASPANLKLGVELLERVVQDRQATAAQRTNAHEFLVLAFAALGRKADAQELLQGELPRETLHRLRHELVRWEAMRSEVALTEARLAVLRRLQKLAPSVAWQREEAGCLLTLRQFDAARMLYQTLDSTLSREVPFVQEHAAARRQLGTRDDLVQATELYRRLDRLCTPGAKDWLEAKYQHASTLAELGEKPRALALLRVTAEVWLKDPKAQVDGTLRQMYSLKFQELEAKLGRR